MVSIAKPLVATVTDLGDRVMICLAGALDAFGVASAGGALDRAIALGANSLVIDVEQVSFIDSAGVGFLVSAHRRAIASGKSLVVERAWGHVRKVIEMTGVDRLVLVAH
ncbi:MAG TPA: STAS domain-containing protein [Acidimicrobiales bacterium]|nr:STAS domain-containing protein [Acidimicrobiales bacterium]